MPREIVFKARRALEIPFDIDTCMETEFEHAPGEGVYYKHIHAWRMVLDGVMNVLDFHSHSP